MKNRTVLLTIAIFTIVSSLFAQQTGTYTKSISWTNATGLQTRSTRIYVPATYNAANSYKLVIGLHGLGSNPTSYMENTKFFSTNTFFGNVILACPSEGTTSTSWFVTAEDFGIVSGIINDLFAIYNIDTGSVFLQGFSFGGKSAYMHGLNEANLLKGIIAFSPGFYSTPDVYNTCNDPVQCQFTFQYQNAPPVKRMHYGRFG
jgi:poly(3-hydroxybutyrate) depolymerase